jgi:CRP/FNR family transcriptional regulator, cyclic AMP receptor protein
MRDARPIDSDAAHGVEASTGHRWIRATAATPFLAVSKGVVSGPRAYVLTEDPELADTVPGARREAASQASLAEVVEVAAGLWNARAEAERARDGYGLLVLDGVLIRRVGYGGRFGAELLAAGDLLRPWEFDGDELLGYETAWRVLVPTRLAVLDLLWTERMVRFPRVGPALAGRALVRSRRLTALMAIVQQPRLDDRLWMLFWELAERYGRVHTDGVHLDLPLTHEVLSHLVAARRPSVSGALTKLAVQGRVRRNGRGWILSGDPPG